MQLDKLVGSHILSGVETGVLERKTYSWEEHCNYIKFTLDGVTYMAVEDPDDGYRSFMEELEISKEPCKVSLPNIEVFCTMMADDRYERNDVLLFFDILSGKEILSVGTENYDDYYPCCHLEYHPENMYCNRMAEDG